MNTALHLIKVVGAALFALGAAVCLFVALPFALPAAAVSIAFSIMPE